MNHYTLAEMVPGLSEEFTVTVTAEMMDQFKAITGDVSPIHIDADYAKDRGFPGRVVYGMLGAFTCLASTACCMGSSASLPSPSSSAIR